MIAELRDEWGDQVRGRMRDQVRREDGGSSSEGGWVIKFGGESGHQMRWESRGSSAGRWNEEPGPAVQSGEQEMVGEVDRCDCVNEFAEASCQNLDKL